MGKRAIFAVFIFVLVTTPIVYLYSQRFGEPYPALMMPSFSGQHVLSKGNIRLTATEITVGFSDGSEKALSVEKLLGHIPDSHRGAIAYRMFRSSHRSDRGSPIGSQSWIGRVKQLVAPVRYRSWDSNWAIDAERQTQQWLERRVNSIFSEAPSQPVKPVFIRFDWFHEKHSVHSGRSGRLVTRDRFDSYQVDFSRGT